MSNIFDRIIDEESTFSSFDLITSPHEEDYEDNIEHLEKNASSLIKACKKVSYSRIPDAIKVIENIRNLSYICERHMFFENLVFRDDDEYKVTMTTAHIKLDIDDIDLNLLLCPESDFDNSIEEINIIQLLFDDELQYTIIQVESWIEGMFHELRIPAKEDYGSFCMKNSNVRIK